MAGPGTPWARGRGPSRAAAGVLAVAVVLVLVVVWRTNEGVLSQMSLHDGYVQGRPERYEQRREPSSPQPPREGGRDEGDDRRQEPGLWTPENPPIEVTDASSYAREAGRLDRLYCMVPTMYSAKRKIMWDAILRTWGPRCDVIKFFVDPPARGESAIPAEYRVAGTDLRVEIVVVPMKRRGGTCQDGLPCRHIWEKVWRSWAYVYVHDLTSAEWFVKVDDDTYLMPSNLRRYVRQRGWSHNDPHYFGFVVNTDAPPYRLISGVCTAMSRETVARLGPRVQNLKSEYGPRENFPNSHGQCVDRDGATEERVTSKCLQEMGVYAEDTLEDGMREYVVPLGIPFTLTYFRKPDTRSWYWQGKTRTRGTMHECCSAHAWAIHGYKQASRLMEMENFMTGMSRTALARRRDGFEPGTDSWEHMDYILRLREGISGDPLSYPASSV